MTQQRAQVSSDRIPLDDILTLAKEFILIPSAGDDLEEKEKILALAKGTLQGFTVETFNKQIRPSLLIHNQPEGTKQFKIVFNVHLDVVPGSDEQYIPLEKDGKLYGRGAYDMKAAAATIIVLFKNLAKSVPYPLALQITSDEEIGANGAADQVAEGVRADFVITGECGSNFKITHQTKGVCHIKLTANGTASHGAYPWLGDNAIMKLHKAIELITAKYPRPEEEAFVTTVNVTRIATTNNATNRIPDQAEAYLDIRYIPEDKDIYEGIKSLVPEGVTATVDTRCSPLDTPEDNEYVQLLKTIGKQVLNQEIQMRVAHASSDVIRFADAGCQGIEFGPIGSNQHTDGEYVDIKSLEDYYQILHKFLMSVK